MDYQYVPHFPCDSQFGTGDYHGAGQSQLAIANGLFESPSSGYTDNIYGSTRYSYIAPAPKSAPHTNDPRNNAQERLFYPDQMRECISAPGVFYDYLFEYKDPEYERPVHYQDSIALGAAPRVNHGSSLQGAVTEIPYIRRSASGGSPSNNDSSPIDSTPNYTSCQSLDDNDETGYAHSEAPLTWYIQDNYVSATSNASWSATYGGDDRHYQGSYASDRRSAPAGSQAAINPRLQAQTASADPRYHIDNDSDSVSTPASQILSALSAASRDPRRRQAQHQMPQEGMTGWEPITAARIPPSLSTTKTSSRRHRKDRAHVSPAATSRVTDPWCSDGSQEDNKHQASELKFEYENPGAQLLSPAPSTHTSPSDSASIGVSTPRASSPPSSPTYHHHSIRQSHSQSSRSNRRKLTSSTRQASSVPERKARPSNPPPHLNPDTANSGGIDSSNGDNLTGTLLLQLDSTKSTPEKKSTVACLFCRERKIACGPPPADSEDRTCKQCARRHLKCEYPLESYRGQRRGGRKKKKVEEPEDQQLGL